MGRLGRSARSIGDFTALFKLTLAVPVALGALLLALGGPGWVAIAIPAIGLLGALVQLALGIALQRTQADERRATRWIEQPGRARDLLTGDEPYDLGVATEAPNALEAIGLEGHSHAPYLSRDIDSDLDRRLEEAAARPGASLIVVQGPSRAGKSRTMLEAVARVLGDAWLIAPAHQPEKLTELAKEPPPPEIGPGPCVIWLDDIEPFARGLAGPGLNPMTLKAFDEWQRPVLVLATAGGKGAVDSDAPEEASYSSLVVDLLRRYPPLFLGHNLSAAEQDRFEELPYSDSSSEQIASEGIGAFMVAASDLVHRLDQGAHECREGLAVVQAAVDWRRAALFDPVPKETLRKLYRHYLPGPDSDDRFQEGLRWACDPIYSTAALLRGSDEFQPDDYIVSTERDRNRQVPTAAWETIIQACPTADQLADVAISAFLAGEEDMGVDALDRGDELGSGRCAYNLGVWFKDRNEHMKQAEEAWQRAHDRGDRLASPPLGWCFYEREEYDEAERIWKAGIERENGRSAFLLGTMLAEQDRSAEAREAFQHGDQLNDARASYQLGWMLMNEGDVQQAKEAWERARDRAATVNDTKIWELACRSLLEASARAGATWCRRNRGQSNDAS